MCRKNVVGRIMGTNCAGQMVWGGRFVNHIKYILNNIKIFWCSLLIESLFATNSDLQINLIVRNSKLVILQAMRNRLLELAWHNPVSVEWNQDCVISYWWPPNMDILVQKYIENCQGCQLDSQPERPYYSISRELISHWIIWDRKKQTVNSW